MSEFEEFAIPREATKPYPAEIKRLQETIFRYGADLGGVSYVLSELAQASIAKNTRNLSDVGCELYIQLNEAKRECSENRVAEAVRSITDHMRSIERGGFDPE